MSDRDVADAKQELRDVVWDALREAGVARFPGARGRIPNFTGAEAAAERLRGTSPWRAAVTVKANPDSPQWPVRQRALEDGCTVFMAVPRLRDERPFLRLDPDLLEVRPRAASSIKGSSEHGVPTAVDELVPVDLVVVGCVAVDRSGARVGKGGGFADLEFALATAAYHQAPLVALYAWPLDAAWPPALAQAGYPPPEATGVIARTCADWLGEGDRERGQRRRLAAGGGRDTPCNPARTREPESRRVRRSPVRQGGRGQPHPETLASTWRPVR